jgi:hypothetical protein
MIDFTARGIAFISTLPLLNGYIYDQLYQYRKKAPTLNTKEYMLLVIGKLEASQEINDPDSPKKIRKEYQRVIKLLKYDVKHSQR